MTAEKEKLLEEVYRHFLKVSLTEPGATLDGANTFIVNDIMGYGTGADEKILSFGVKNKRYFL